MRNVVGDCPPKPNDQNPATNLGYENLRVWQLSMELVEEVYRLVKQLPKEETYALSDQMRRSAVSIPSNIAEGASRRSKKEFVQFLYIALGSTSELETQLRIAERVGYTKTADVIADRIIPVKKMLNALIKSKKGELVR